MAPKKKKLTKQQKKFKRAFKKKQDENPSIADAIFNIANSFQQTDLAPEGSSPSIEVLIALAIIGWNHSLLPEESQRNVYDSVEDNLPTEFGTKGVADMVGLIDIFAAEKQRLYPDIKKTVEDYKIRIDSNGNKVLDVTSVPI